MTDRPVRLTRCAKCERPVTIKFEPTIEPMLPDRNALACPHCGFEERRNVRGAVSMWAGHSKEPLE